MRVALILIARTAPVASACKVTSNATRKVPALKMITPLAKMSGPLREVAEHPRYGTAAFAVGVIASSRL